MEFKELEKRPGYHSDKKLAKKYAEFDKLIDELKKKEIPEEIVNRINQDIEELNTLSGSNSDFLKQLRKVQSGVLKLVEKELKLVIKNHYRNMWLGIGVALGVPFGVAFGTSLGNMAFIGIGIPIGMAIGIAIGTSMDTNAQKNGKQLDIDVGW